MVRKEPTVSFSVRIYAEDGIDLAAFDAAAEAHETTREGLVRQLMSGFLARLGTPEQYYTIRGYSADHRVWASIVNLDGHVEWNQDGIEYRSTQWQLLEHAIMLVERGQSGDKEEATALLGQLFGERNVLLKDESE